MLYITERTPILKKERREETRKRTKGTKKLFLLIFHNAYYEKWNPQPNFLNAEDISTNAPVMVMNLIFWPIV